MLVCVLGCRISKELVNDLFLLRHWDGWMDGWMDVPNYTVDIVVGAMSQIVKDSCIVSRERDDREKMREKRKDKRTNSTAKA